MASMLTYESQQCLRRILFSSFEFMAKSRAMSNISAQSKLGFFALVSRSSSIVLQLLQLFILLASASTPLLLCIPAQSHYGAQVHRPPHYHYSYQVIDPQGPLQFPQERQDNLHLPGEFFQSASMHFQ